MAKKKKIDKPSYIDDEHGTLIGWVNESEDVTSKSYALSEKARDYYDSKQLTADEIKALTARKQAPVVINRCKPKMDALMGIEQANKTTVKAFPRTPKHEKSAEACTESVRFVLQDNSFNKIRAAAWETILIEGTGGCEVIVRQPKRPEDGLRITINQIMWDRIIYDPHSRKKDFSDAKFLGQVVWMDYDDAVYMYPDAEDVLDSMISGSQTYDDKPRWMDGVRRRVKIVELYYKKDGEVYFACFTRGGYCVKPNISPYKNEEGETEWPYEYASAFVDRDGGRYGAMLQLLDVQDEINKRRSKALHLMSVRQVRWERGAVEDINKARQELAKPDGVLETTPGMEFEILKTGDMAAAQFNLLTEAKQEIDAVGANAAVMGKDESVQSGVALQQRAQAGQTEIGPMLAVLKDMDYRVYRKVWNRIKQYWKAEKWIRVTDDENNLRWVGLNAPITKGQQAMEAAQAQGLPPEQLQMLQQKIDADPMSKEIVDTKNDIADLDVDLVITEVPDVLTSQIENFQVLGEMVKSGFQLPPEAVIEASPLSNKDKILKMMKAQPQIPPQLQKQMEQTAEQMKALTEENQQLKSGAQDEAAKLVQKQRQQQDEFALKQQAQDEELKLAREKADAEIQLRRDIAQAEYDIEERKLAQSHQHETNKLSFEKERHQSEQQADADATAVPQVAETLTQMTELFAVINQNIEKQTAIAEKSLQTEESILQHQMAPKNVRIGGLQKDASGHITGANVSTALQ